MALIGVLIAMGLANFQDLDDYWEKRGKLHMPWFSAVISSLRFKQILRFLHLVDNDKNLPRSDPNFNERYKLGSFPDDLSKSFKEMCSPPRNLSIDESTDESTDGGNKVQYRLPAMYAKETREVLHKVVGSV